MALNINGTTGISGVDGSASAPALQGTDSNTGINFGSDTVNINTGGSTKASISSVGKLTLTSTETANSNPVVLNASGQAYFQVITPNNTIGGFKFGDVDDDDVGAIKYGHGDNRMQFDVNASERIRIDSGGNVGIGTTQPNNADSADGGLQINPNLSSGAPQVAWKRASTGNTSYAAAFTNGSTGVGSISYNNGGTSFNTSSDYRLKENVVALSDGITRLKTLKPYRFNFIVDADKTVDGFLAHEVTPVVPEAITGEKDATENILYNEGETIPSGKKVGDIKETKPIYQGIDQAKLVPLLTAALQEAIAKIELLETKVAALEAE